VLDIISPCVTFGNHENSVHSYNFGKEHESPLQEISYIPAREEITIEDFEEGTTRDVTLHDGSTIILRKLEKDYDPYNKYEALKMLEEAEEKNWLVTGLIYIDPNVPSMFDMYNLPDTPLNRMKENQLRPDRSSLQKINELLL
jgi:2-oxoglutarate ferredoxin oxidoreductase subunit beta